MTSETISQYWHLIIVFIPLGIVGVWRWSVWLIRKTISFFYRVPEGNFRSSLSIITPVYNENPELFRRALKSWKSNDPDEIIAVIDYADKDSIRIFKNFAGGFLGARLIVTEKPGKRPALADGIRAAKGKIVALVDSDTVWSPNIKNAMLGPFADPQVGGLVPRQDVFETDTLARKLFKILLDDRYLLEYPALATVSDALLCLSGRTAVYRRAAVLDKLDTLVNETFWGKKMISGDDKTLTRLVQAEGWKTRYLKNVAVYTSGTPDLRKFLMQKLRWARNGMRSDSKVLFSGWLWKRHKTLGLYMLDKLVSPITLLLGPIYFAISLYFGYWQAAAAILIWWLVSRTIKIYPHLREKPSDVFILPAYILMTFAMAVVKIYALITIDEQGWITRWDKRRLIPPGFFRRAVSYAATGALLFALSFAVFNFENNALKTAQAEKEKTQALLETQRAQNAAIFTPDLPRLSDGKIKATKAALEQERQDDPYGYFAVKSGDTAGTLRQRFNLPAGSQILDAGTKKPVGNFELLAVGRRLAIPAEGLRNPLNKNILAARLLAKPPRVAYEAASNTIFVREGGSVATLSTIRQALNPASRRLLEQTAPGEWILRSNLYIGKAVTLVLDGSEVKCLKLKSDDGFVWIRSEAGSILISGTKVTSWDEKNKAPDYDYADGRSYITARNDGRMDIINSELAYLGHKGLPRVGGPFGGSYGVSWKLNSNSFRDRLLTGVVLDSKFHNNYFGLYAFGATGLLIRGNEFYENVNYGLDPHDDSNNLLIENNRAYRNGNHGIILSRRCFSNIIRGNISFDNRLHGIMLDRSSNNNLVEKNTVYGNVDGIAIYGSDRNMVAENEIRHNIRGVRLNAGSAENYFEKNSILENSRGVYIYDQARKNLLVSNTVGSNEIGITLANASENSLYDNFKISDNKRDARITDDAYGNNIQ